MTGIGALPRVLLADDSRLFLESAQRLIAARCNVIGVVHDGVTLLREAWRLSPDVIIADITMPGISGLEALRTLRNPGAGWKIVMLTMHGEPEVVREAFALGADAFVLKADAYPDLMEAIQAVGDGRKFLSSGVRFQT